jgi:hypothetical protein
MLYLRLLPRRKQLIEPHKTTAVKDTPVRLATCLDRSAAASGATASRVSPRLPWGKLLSLAERLAAHRRPAGDPWRA